MHTLLCELSRSVVSVLFITICLILHNALTAPVLQVVGLNNTASMLPEKVLATQGNTTNLDKKAELMAKKLLSKQWKGMEGTNDKGNVKHMLCTQCRPGEMLQQFRCATPSQGENCMCICPMNPMAQIIGKKTDKAAVSSGQTESQKLAKGKSQLQQQQKGKVNVRSGAQKAKNQTADEKSKTKSTAAQKTKKQTEGEKKSSC